MPIEHFAIHPMPLFIPMIETMCEKLNMRHYGAAVMANLEGAFDATWSIVLIYKLYKAGVKDMLLTILENFLTNRFSRNLLNGYSVNGLKAISNFLRSPYSVQHYF